MDLPQNKSSTETESEGLEKKYSKWWDRKEKPEQQYSYQKKIDFKARVLKRDPEGHFIIVKRRAHQEDINISMYEPNIGAPKYIRKILEDFNKYIENNNIIVEDFSTQVSKMDRSYKQNINKDIVALNNVLD